MTPREGETATPGPWRVVEEADSQLPFAVMAGDIYVATPHLYADGSVEANARLIAAAPELLAALKTARRVLEVACGTQAPYIREAFKVIDLAIAKAEPLAERDKAQ